MTRQVAIAALIAFAATVLVLSLWSPAHEAPATAPAPPQPLEHVAPAAKRPVNTSIELRQDERARPYVVSPSVAARLGLPQADAGAP